MRSILKYNSDQERFAACREGDTIRAAIAKRLDHIMEAHRSMTYTDEGKPRNIPVPCAYIHAALVADVLKYVITETLHTQAEQDFLFNREIYEGDQNEQDIQD